VLWLAPVVVLMAAVGGTYADVAWFFSKMDTAGEVSGLSWRGSGGRSATAEWERDRYR
jgi:hypothetical protein